MLFSKGIIHLQQDHSSIHNSHGSRTAITKGRFWTPWLATMRTLWAPSRICGVQWKGQSMKSGLSSLPEIAMSYVPFCKTRGMKLLRLCITFDHWLSRWHDKWKQWWKQKGSGLLIKEVNLWKQPLQGLNYEFSFFMSRCDTSSVTVTRQSTRPCLLRLWFQIPPGTWKSFLCDWCVFWRLLLERVKLARLHKETCR